VVVDLVQEMIVVLLIHLLAVQAVLEAVVLEVLVVEMELPQLQTQVVVEVAQVMPMLDLLLLAVMALQV
jgi:hypothetical protein